MADSEKTLVITEWPDGRFQVLGPTDDLVLTYQMLRNAWAMVDEQLKEKLQPPIDEPDIAPIDEQSPAELVGALVSDNGED